jgi:predicted phage tail protein
MTDIPGQGQPPRGQRKGVRSGESPFSVNPPPTRPSPTDRIEKAKEAHIEHLDRERQRLLDRVEQLQALVDRIGPENARLHEALANAVANNVLATILVAIGGGAISFATFAEGASKAVAYVGVAILASGVLVLLFPAFRGRGSRSAQPR